MTIDTQTHGGLLTTIVRRRLGRFDWLIADSFLSSAWMSRLERPEHLLQPPAEPLKKSVVPGREVVHVRVDDTTAVDVTVKHFTPRGLVEIVKSSCRGSPAFRAFHLARQIEALGFFTAAPVAAGERRAGGLLCESFLLTRFMAGAIPLHLVNAHCADRRRRIGVVRGLAKLYAAMHDAGFYHRDPSQANFLVVAQPTGGDTIALIDLDGLRQRREISLTAAARDLRRLLRRSQIPRKERAWFITVYARSRRTRLSSRQLVKLIGDLPAQATFPHCALNEESLPSTTVPAASTNSPTLSTRLGNFSESSSRIDIKQSNGLQWLVRSSRLSPQMETVLQAPDQFLEHARVLKPSRSSAVGAAGGIVLKRYNYRKWTSRFKDWFRPSRGRRSFEKAHLLETAGVRTAGPIAAAERRCCGVVVRSYFVMTEIPGAVPLGSWSGDKRAACKQVAELLARLHQEGFTHRDLKEGNILFDAAGQPHLIDLDGLRYVRETTHQQAVADLRRLARGKAGWRHRLTRSDRARFLLAYCRARGLSDWRWWWREIQQHR